MRRYPLYSATKREKEALKVLWDQVFRASFFVRLLLGKATSARVKSNAYSLKTFPRPR